MGRALIEDEPTYSREAEHHSPEHAGRGFIDGGELHIRRCQTGWPDDRLRYAGSLFQSAHGHEGVQFDWAKFTWIGSPERTVRIIYGRSDTPYKTLDDIRVAPEHPRCGATAGTVGHYFPRLIEESRGSS